MIDLDGISGSPINIKEVPTKERGIIEITADTMVDLTTPEGWKDYSKKAFKWGGGVASGMAPKISNLLGWMISTRAGQITGLFIIAVILIAYISLKS